MSLLPGFFSNYIALFHSRQFRATYGYVRVSATRY